MCGIAGYISTETLRGTSTELLSMTRALRRRGPDDEGFVLIDTAQDRHLDLCGAESDRRIQQQYDPIERSGSEFPHDIALGHRRYSIIDLSPEGHQPMWDAGKNACVSFYGEIYNYLELRSELEIAGAVFRSRSDTEVILKAYLHWGTAAFEKFNGPFALALYDRRIRKLLLARDRIGKASFYYTVRNNRFHWATEIKSFLRIYGTDGFTINDRAVDQFLCHGLRDYDGTFWNEVHDFPPASFAWVQPDLTLEAQCYWQLPTSRSRLRDVDEANTVAEFKSLLVDAIRIRKRADVPVAFELSGGMDSSSIVGLAATSIPGRHATFTIKHPEKHSDEEPYARMVAELFRDRIDSQILVPRKNDFWNAADEFVWVEEEPFHSPNLQTNQQLRREMRAAGFKVVIAGSAGDEVLAGYAGDYLVPFLIYLMRCGACTSLIRESIQNTEMSLPSLLRSLAIAVFVPPAIRARHKRHRILPFYNPGSAYRQDNDPLRPALARLSFEDIMRANMGPRKMNYWLRSGPKAMFGIPIEPRSPFLDYRLVEFCFTLPPELLVRNGWFKWILRQAVRDILPDEIVWRQQKMGFPFPLREWLSHSKGSIDVNLRGVECPYVNVDRLLDSFDSLTHRNPDELWRLISLVLWWRKVIEGRSISPGAEFLREDGPEHRLQAIGG